LVLKKELPNDLRNFIVGTIVTALGCWAPFFTPIKEAILPFNKRTFCPSVTYANSAIFPTYTSLVSTSACNPNVYGVNYADYVVVIARKPIKKGEKLRRPVVKWVAGPAPNKLLFQATRGQQLSCGNKECKQCAGFSGASVEQFKLKGDCKCLKAAVSSPIINPAKVGTKRGARLPPLCSPSCRAVSSAYPKYLFQFLSHLLFCDQHLIVYIRVGSTN
jgi:hypothetical protein